MLLEIKDLTFKHGYHTVFDQAEMMIDRPGIYGLIGPNGAGKTTLLELISGLRQPQAGTIRVFDQARPDAGRLSFVQDSTVLYPYLSGTDHFKFICGQHDIEPAEVRRVTDLLQMTDYIDRKVRTYSLGMKQRLLLGLGLVKKPELLLLDEPLNGLDPTSTMMIRKLLLELGEAGTTILISSHQLAEMDLITHQLFFIKDHHILSEKSADGSEARYRELFE